MPYDLGVLGSMTSAGEMTDAALDILKTWLPAALTAINSTGYGLPDEQFVGVMTWDKVPTSMVEEVADQVPAVYVSSNGTSGAPKQIGRGESYSSWFDLRVMVVDRSDGGWGMTTDRIQHWAAMVRTTLLQHQSLNGLAQKVEFTGESYGAINADAGRTYAGTIVTFRVLLGDITERGSIGPLTPPPVVDPDTGLAAALPDGPVATSYEGTYTDAPL